MNSLVFHVVSGQSFFTGAVLIILSVAASRSTRRSINRFTILLFLLGCTLVTISSTPVPYWCCAILIATTAAWIASRFVLRWRRLTAMLAVAAWLVAAAIELPHHRMPTLKPRHYQNVVIIGDSLTAGIGSSTARDRWPQLLARRGFATFDISHAGDSTADALERFRSRQIAPLDADTAVIVEIGGNDILSGTPPVVFASDLRALLTQVGGGEATVVMFELPLPPFAQEYGRIQRTLAKEYRVMLIPKRFLLSVLGADDSTLDTIHLSKTGHQRMAKLVGDLFAVAESEVSGSWSLGSWGSPSLGLLS